MDPQRSDKKAPLILLADLPEDGSRQTLRPREKEGAESAEVRSGDGTRRKPAVSQQPRSSLQSLLRLVLPVLVSFVLGAVVTGLAAIYKAENTENDHQRQIKVIECAVYETVRIRFGEDCERAGGHMIDRLTCRGASLRGPGGYLAPRILEPATPLEVTRFEFPLPGWDNVCNEPM